MRLGRPAVPLAALLTVGGCGGASGSPDDGRTIAVYAAVVRRVVLQDNTFGGGPAPFKKIFLLDAPVANAGTATDDTRPGTPFSDAVRDGLRKALTDLPPLEFVARADDARTTDPLRPRDDGLILTLGPILGSGDHVRVPNGMWCGGTCGQWLTYKVERTAGQWHVRGPDGAIAIS